MMGILSSLNFLYPALLWTALALPILWFVFKTIPPHPRLIKLPTARFLKDIETEDSQKDDIPWWLKALRILMMAMIILAAAAPFLAPKTDITIDGEALGIVFDNSWAAAPQLENQKDKALSLILRAEQKGKNIVLIEAIPEHKNLSPITIVTPADARNRVKHIHAYPWEADHSALLEALKAQQEKLTQAKTYHWLGHGYNDGDIEVVSDYIAEKGKVIYYKPEDKKIARTLKSALNKDGRDSYKFMQFDGFYYNDQSDFKLYLKDRFSTVLSFIGLDDILNNTNEDITTLWNSIDNDDDAVPSYMQLGIFKHAGAVYYLPAEILKQKVGVLSAHDAVDNEESPLIQSIYYISKAVEGKAPYSIDPLDKLLDWGAKLIIVPEDFVLSQKDIQRLDKWVNDGGTLLRFPPSKQGHGETIDTLIPIELLAEERSIAGRLDWQEPLTLAKIPEDSPLAGIPLDKSLEIKRQVLATPSAKDHAQIWAVASDGTPIISARAQGHGLIILIHTQAKPGWSNMPITGFFVNVLHRIVDISSGARMQISKTTDIENPESQSFAPYKLINASGELVAPDQTQAELTIQDIRSKPLSYDFRPGIYHSNNAEYIINLGDKLGPLRLVSAKDIKGTIEGYSTEVNINLQIYFLLAALFLFFCEWLSSALLSGARYKLHFVPRFKASILLCALLIGLLTAAPAWAQSRDDAERANSLNLAYVETANPIVNAMAQKGLQYVANAIMQRTALQNVRVTPVNISNDDLAFYPLLYWPIESTPLGDKAYAKLNDYMNTGGMLFVDIRNGRKLSQSFYAQNQPLSLLSEKLFIPLLKPLPEEHVLRKSYYLLSTANIAGRYDGGDIWLDLGDNSGSTAIEDNQHVAAFIIGANDWISLWADESADIYKREKALRFGINLVMYALTGTYKQDQVHTKAILERLEQRQQQLRQRRP